MELNQEMQLDKEYMMPTFGRYPVEFVTGRGMHLYDAQGEEYLDFLSGIGVCSLGHCHPTVVEAISQQAAKLIHVSNYFYIEKRGAVAKRLSDLLARTYDVDTGISATNGADCALWQTFFANSGAEANECAIKLARIHYRKRHKQTEGVHASVSTATASSALDVPLVVALSNSFHGRTLGSLASTGQPRLHQGFEPIPDGFIYTPINDIAALQKLFEEHRAHICAVMVECIQGESGIHPCDAAFLREIRQLCDASGALMVCDEVQSGIFRTGRPFAFQHFGIVPDVVTMAKGIASGVPAAACSARAEIAAVLTPGTHGSTFGGSNLAMAAALATLETLDDAETEKRVTATGALLRERLAALPQVTQTRGLGLMCAAALEEGIDAHDVVSAGLEAGIIMNAPNDTTLRLLPPLICTADDVEDFVARLAGVLEQFRRSGVAG